MNKKGQFFLIAAIIIIGIVISLATAVNTARVGGSNKAFYDLADEVDFETKRVLDYGVFTTGQNPQILTENFLLEYVDYLASDQVVFIYGNAGSLQGIWFSGDLETGVVGIDTGGISASVLEIRDLVDREAEVTENQAQGTVTVLINDIPYVFDLRPGQNFFFVIIKEQEDERFVAKG